MTVCKAYEFLTSYAYKKAAETLPFEEKVKMLEGAIDGKTKLEMTYLKSNDTKSQRIIIPLRVGKEHYQGKPFPGLLAYCMKSNENRMFNVARILALEEV